MAKLTTAAIKVHLDELTKIQSNWKKITDHIDRYALDQPKNKHWKRLSKRKIDGDQVIRLFTLESEENELRMPLARVVTDYTDTKIVRVTFGQSYEPVDFIFAFEPPADDGEFVCITLKSVWDAEGYASDQSEADEVLPPEFYQVMESVYGYTCDKETARKILVLHGFTENAKFSKFINKNR